MTVCVCAENCAEMRFFMRISDLNYLSGTTAPKAPDGNNAAAPDTEALSEGQARWKKAKNWWYYYKWYVICGVILAGIIVNIAGSYLGLWTKAPDLQIAYIGRAPLPADTVSALEQAFASLISDFNGDGKIIVRINQYTSGLPGDDADMVSYEYASEISLIGDISDGESYLFLMDDPAEFQRDFQLLALPDGSCPDDTDYSVEDKVILWAACPLLTTMELGSYSVSIPGETSTAANQELLAGLYLGRRCFFTSKVTPYSDKCSLLWEALADSAR